MVCLRLQRQYTNTERNSLDAGRVDRQKPLMEISKMAKSKRYVIVRTTSAGVFAGILESRKGREVVLTKARRLWFWKGAASLSQLAMSGTTAPTECKFPEIVDHVELLEAIEILDVTKQARVSIEGVPVWKA